jgi:RNase P subunit RPR2
MKLIAKGPDQHDYGIQRIICKNCRAVLDFDRHDIDLRIVNFVYYASVMCPACNKYTAIP